MRLKTARNVKDKWSLTMMWTATHVMEMTGSMSGGTEEGAGAIWNEKIATGSKVDDRFYRRFVYIGNERYEGECHLRHKALILSEEATKRLVT